MNYLNNPNQLIKFIKELSILLEKEMSRTSIGVQHQTNVFGEGGTNETATLEKI